MTSWTCPIGSAYSSPARVKTTAWTGSGAFGGGFLRGRRAGARAAFFAAAALSPAGGSLTRLSLRRGRGAGP
jgi:hypothetical protein